MRCSALPCIRIATLGSERWLMSTTLHKTSLLKKCSLTSGGRPYTLLLGKQCLQTRLAHISSGGTIELANRLAAHTNSGYQNLNRPTSCIAVPQCPVLVRLLVDAIGHLQGQEREHSNRPQYPDNFANLRLPPLTHCTILAQAAFHQHTVISLSFFAACHNA